MPQVVNNADVLFVAVKPQVVKSVLTEARPFLGTNHTIVSIAAGITVDTCVAAARLLLCCALAHTRSGALH